MKELSFERMTEIEGGASLAAWGCGISIGIVGALWSTAFGMVSAGAGFVVGDCISHCSLCRSVSIKTKRVSSFKENILFACY